MRLRAAEEQRRAAPVAAIGQIAVRAPQLGAFVFADRVRRAVEELQIDEVGSITISAGVAEFDADAAAQSVIARADERLYDAKKSGRNRVL